MTEVAGLEIRVNHGDIPRATSELDKLAKTGGKTERATDGITRSFSRLIGPLTAVVSVTAGLNKLISVTREFNAIETSLVTVTGSAERATDAFEAIQDFATKTPFDLQQVSRAFITLVNLGLDPSERAMNSYGSTAASLGQSLDGLIEAVADVTRGQFQRIEKFGISAKTQGENIIFTFRGVKTAVANNAKDIEEFLISLGENNFGDAMARQAATLDGAISNLSDEWDKLFLNISKQDIGGIIEGAVRLGIEVLAELNAMLASGQMQGNIDAILSKFLIFGSEAAKGIEVLNSTYTLEMEDIRRNGGETAAFLLDAFTDMPENIKAIFQVLVVEVASALDRISATSQAFKDGLSAIFTDDTIEGVAARLQQRINAINSARVDSTQQIFDERQAALSSFDAQIEKATELRQTFDDAQAAKANSGTDRTAQFAIDTPVQAGQTKDQGNSKAEASRLRDFEKLVESLRTEEEAILESFERRNLIIEQNTEAGSEIRQRLSDRLQEQLATDLLNLEAQREASRQSLFDGLLTEEEALISWYDRKRALILENEEITELDRQDLLSRLKDSFDEKQKEMQIATIQNQLNNAESLFGGLAGIAKAGAGEQSKVYKGLFATSKAFGIAQAAVSLATGISKDASLGSVASIAAIAKTVATVAAAVGQIRSATFAGNFDRGGIIPAGSFGVVGEVGPEIVRGPATVTGREDTARLFKDSQDSAPQQNSIRIVNAFDPQFIGDFMGSDEGEEVIMNIVQKNRSLIGVGS